MFIVIATMVAVWLAIVLCRNPIRARWWTHRLATTANPETRLAHFQRLVALGPTGADAVEELLESDDPSVRGLGVAVLNHTRPARVRKLLAEMATDPDPDVAAMAVTGLALLGDPAVVNDLAQLLKSSEARLAVLAVSGLGRLPTPEAADLLIETARAHRLVAVRVQAIEELGLLRVERAADVLRECLEDDTLFQGPTTSEHSAAALLGRATRGLTAEAPSARPVSYFANRALRAITGEDVSSNGK